MPRVGAEATQLLQRMSAHSLDKSPAAFLEHADRMLSAALQTGNAHVATHGAADLLLHSYHVSVSGGVSRWSEPAATHQPVRQRQRLWRLRLHRACRLPFGGSACAELSQRK